MDNGWEPWTIVWRLDNGMKTGEWKGYTTEIFLLYNDPKMENF